MHRTQHAHRSHYAHQAHRTHRTQQIEREREAGTPTLGEAHTEGATWRERSSLRARPSMRRMRSQLARAPADSDPVCIRTGSRGHRDALGRPHRGRCVARRGQQEPEQALIGPEPTLIGKSSERDPKRVARRRERLQRSVPIRSPSRSSLPGAFEASSSTPASANTTIVEPNSKRPHSSPFARRSGRSR